MRASIPFARYRPTLCALLVVSALGATACNREPRPAVETQVAESTPAANPPAAPAPPAAGLAEKPYIVEEPSAAPAPTTPELVREPQTIEVSPAAPEPNRQSSREESLARRERQIAERQAQLEARERQLRREEEHRPPIEPAPIPAAAEPDEMADVPAPEPEPEPVREAPAPRLIEATVPAGTSLDVEFTSDLSSATSAVGDTFRARVAGDVYQDGVLVIPRGSEVVGEVSQAVPLRRVGGKATLGLRFTDLVMPSGETTPLVASFVEQGRSETGRDAATIGGSAAGGAILGRILNKGNKGRGSVIGAIIGAAAGTAIAARTPGQEVTIPEGTVIGIRLDRSVEVRRRQ